MTHKAVFTPFWASVLECDMQGCDNINGTLADDASEVREEAAGYDAGWSYDENTDEDFCRKCTKLREGN